MRLSNIPPVIGLHYVSDDARLEALRPWSISYNAFVRLLDCLKDEGYAVVGFEEIINGVAPQKSTVITFDDCPKHLFDFAIPELIKRGMKAVFYISTANIGGYNVWNVVGGLPRINLMDEADIRRLVELGMEVGSHSHRHIMLGDAKAADVKEQLVKSKAVLENITGKPILTVAYPYGSTPGNYNTVTKEVGYKLGLATYTTHDSIYAIRRWEYYENDSVATIKWRMTRRYAGYRSLSDKWNFVFKKSASALYRVYAKMKHAIFSSTTGLSYYLLSDPLMYLAEENYFSVI